MGRVIRKILRQNYDFPRSGLFGITAVYSTEPARDPEPVTYDGGKVFVAYVPVVAMISLLRKASRDLWHKQFRYRRLWPFLREPRSPTDNVTAVSNGACRSWPIHPTKSFAGARDGRVR